MKGREGETKKRKKQGDNPVKNGKGRWEKERQQGKRQKKATAKKQKSPSPSFFKKKGTPEGSIGKKDSALISTLSVPEPMYLDFFLCGTVRHNQDEPQWIVAQTLSQKGYHLSRAFIIDHTSSDLPNAIRISPKQELKNITGRHQNVVKHCLTNTD